MLKFNIMYRVQPRLFSTENQPQDLKYAKKACNQSYIPRILVSFKQKLIYSLTQFPLLHISKTKAEILFCPQEPWSAPQDRYKTLVKSTILY